MNKTLLNKQAAFHKEMTKLDAALLNLCTGKSLEFMTSFGELIPQIIATVEAHATLTNDCMIEKTWFMKGSRVAALVKYAENVYKAEAVAQNSKIEFGTDDNEIWWAHEVPFFGTVQMDKIVEHGFTEWDICLDKCWQGPFSSQSKAIQHLEECIKEKMEENA